MIMGIINTSGGIGKNDDSTNATTANAQSAWGDCASDKVQA